MRVAAIDVGTNSVHLLIADVQPDGTWTVVEKARRQVELGANGLEHHQLDPDAYRRGLEAMQEFGDAAHSHRAEAIHCAATSAVREAQNGSEWCRDVRRLCGIRVRVISGQEEGRLIYLGARSDLDFSRGKVLLMDLGGGSTEFILCDSEKPHHIDSVPLGHIRLADAFHTEQPMTRASYSALKRQVKDVLAPLGEAIAPRDFHTLVGTAGTIRCLARIATLARGDQLPQHGHGLLLHREEVDRIVSDFRIATFEAIAATPGVDPKRVRTITAGAVLVRQVMRMFRKNRLVTSDRSLRDGLIADWILKNRPEIDLMSMLPNPRDRSVQALMDRYGAHERHSRLIKRLSLKLFDALAPIHRLGYPEREMLGYAALVHDIGHHISGASHNKHGEYLIRHTPMHGFTAPEIDFLAALVRYHRGSRPKTVHATFRALGEREQESVPILAGILRIADALDRSHEQRVQDIDVTSGDGVVTVTARGIAPLHMERWAFEDGKPLIEETLQQEFHIEIPRSDADDAGGSPQTDRIG